MPAKATARNRAKKRQHLAKPPKTLAQARQRVKRICGHNSAGQLKVTNRNFGSDIGAAITTND